VLLRAGVALVRFELDKKRQLVLRVLKYIVPPDPDLVAADFGQVEGELVMRYVRARGADKFAWLKTTTWFGDPERYLSPASIAALEKLYP
jgi:hypothetical protein